MFMLKMRYLKIDKITSKLLAASLIKDKASIKTVDKMIEIASFHGYKKKCDFLA